MDVPKARGWEGNPALTVLCLHHGLGAGSAREHCWAASRGRGSRLSSSSARGCYVFIAAFQSSGKCLSVQTKVSWDPTMSTFHGFH